MKVYLEALKDILVVLSPILVAYISYRSNKKSKREIKQELEKSLREKDAETTQILTKINAELESQKQMAVWNNSLPQTDKYIEEVGIKRYGNISGITELVSKINGVLEDANISIDELRDIKEMLQKIKLPVDEENLYPYEIPSMISYKRILYQIDRLIAQKEV